jgi:hypothetical protein
LPARFQSFSNADGAKSPKQNLSRYVEKKTKMMKSILRIS